MAVRARCIAPAYDKPVKVCMIMIAKNGYQPEFPREGMDLLKGFSGPVSPVDEISQIDQHINLAELLSE
jgi:hypothetical protein